MFRIGVISDTHLADTGECLAFLADLAARHFPRVDLILHAGDIVVPGVLAAFAPCPVIAVRGNMDPPAPGLEIKRVVGADGARIGLIHGWGAREGLVARVRNEFRGVSLDCLVYGHSHMPMCRYENGLLLFNPGSATGPRGGAPASIGLLEAEQGRVSGSIVEVGR